MVTKCISCCRIVAFLASKWSDDEPGTKTLGFKLI